MPTMTMTVNTCGGTPPASLASRNAIGSWRRVGGRVPNVRRSVGRQAANLRKGAPVDRPD